MSEDDLNEGDFVVKIGGDYDFHGTIVSRFQKLDRKTGKAGQVRFVVQNADGVLHIFSDKQLVKTS